MNQRFGDIDAHLHWRAVDLPTEVGGNPVLLIVERIRVDDRMRWMALHGAYIREKLAGRKPYLQGQTDHRTEKSSGARGRQ